ncbi:hypothetical protein B0T13DRAFT_118460 [Neurospora crassa]|nr:hypothetical protein B0T13DRAFT_118460 [Neurospora crassa]
MAFYSVYETMAFSSIYKSQDMLAANNKGIEETDLFHTHELESVDGCTIIKVPRRLNLEKNKKFTDNQVLKMYRFLEDNHASLSELWKTLGTNGEQESMNLFVAKAYNATIEYQQREIMNLRRHQQKPFTFADAECWCTRKFDETWDPDMFCDLVGPVPAHALGCTVPEGNADTDGAGYRALLAQARQDLNAGCDLNTPWLPGQTEVGVPKVAAVRVHDIFRSVASTVDPSNNKNGLPSYEAKFLAMDTMYKIFHCLLTETETPVKRYIKANKKLWRDLENCFLQVFGSCSRDDLYRIATEDGGVWRDKFFELKDLVQEQEPLSKLLHAGVVLYTADEFCGKSEDEVAFVIDGNGAADGELAYW